MSSVINVLLIDDDKDNFDSLRNRAAKNRVILHFKDNLLDGLNELKNNSKLDAVILDGKAFLTPGQKRGTEKENFVHEALSQIKLFEKENGRVIPKCVLTAWYDQLKDSLEGRALVYDKKKVSLDDALMSELFETLKQEVKEAGNFKMRDKYEDVFEATASKYLPNAVDSKLLSVLTLVEEGKIEQNNFNTIREILEALFIRANAIDKNLIPDDLLKADGRPNLEWCCRYVSGMPTEVRDGGTFKNSYPQKASFVPQHISRSIDYVKQISSILSHNYLDNWTKLSFKSAALALGEILIWFKQYIDKNYPNL